MSPIAALIDARLRELGMTPAEAAQVTGMNYKTLSQLLNLRPTGSRVIGSDIREMLQGLGLTPAEIEYAAALTAGFEVTPPEFLPAEWARALRMRSLNERQVAYIDGEIRHWLRVNR